MGKKGLGSKNNRITLSDSIMSYFYHFRRSSFAWTAHFKGVSSLLNPFLSNYLASMNFVSFTNWCKSTCDDPSLLALLNMGISLRRTMPSKYVFNNLFRVNYECKAGQVADSTWTALWGSLSSKSTIAPGHDGPPQDLIERKKERTEWRMGCRIQEWKRTGLGYL